MAHDLDVDPERLHPLARRAAGLLDVLVPLPALDPDTRAALARTPPGAAVLAEVDRATAALAVSGRAVAELAQRLADAATAAQRADAAAGDALARLADDGWAGPGGRRP